MKRCPQCGRDYTDETMNFCLDDGSSLVSGPIQMDEPATAIISEKRGSEPSQSAGRSSAELSSSNRSLPEFGNSIAVLPFKNISADQDNEYFCDGLAEELLNALAKIPGLKVAARSSAFSFKEKNVDIGEIGRKLGVATVLEGSVRKSGDHLRISVQLLNASDGYHIWSETYDREMRDIFDVQDEIRLAVIEALKIKLLGSSQSNILRRETENTDAYKTYLQGKFLRYAKNDHRGAAHAFEEALKLDPSHAPSLLGLAEAWVLQAHYSMLDPLEACSLVRDALATARRIQGESAEALYIDGFAAFIQRDWQACQRAYRHALELNPYDSRSLGTFGVINCILGNFDEAMEFLDRARNVDPLAAYPYAMTGAGLNVSRRLSDALPFLEQALAFDPEQSLALWAFCFAAIGLGKFDTGIAAAKLSVTLTKRAAYSLGLLGWALARAGRIDEATSLLNELRTRPTDSPVVVFEACLLAELGNKDDGFALLSKAADEYAPLATYVGLPCFDWLRDDPRFGPFTGRLGLTQSSI